MVEEQSHNSIVSFGHERLCQHLVKRIDRQFVKPRRNIEPSLVIGLFGEWGSGKSHLLGLLEEEYQHYKITEDQLTIPILFNPWRFEKEEHLIIPLMKTTELALKQCEAWLLSDYPNKAFDDQEKQRHQAAADWASNLIKGTTKLFGVSVLAFISSIKTKVSIPGLGQSTVDGAKLVKAYQDYYPNNPEDQVLDELTSHYFNFHQMLKKATGHAKNSNHSGKKLNLLFLVDDIDRCLPEKAVEMLESIKLFLDVEGCAFLLAVDDEVIERGIVHRYRDYIFQQQSHMNNSTSADKNTADTAPPITGAEYLEKIIHLPFRLPLPSEKEIRQFLLNEFPELFSLADEISATQEEQDLSSAGKTNNRKHSLQYKTALLDLFVRAVPRVPRKLIRAVELFQLQRDIMCDRGMSNLDELTLARLVILQLLLPDFYRFGRQWQGFLGTLERWERDYSGQWALPSMTSEKLEEKEKAAEDFNATIFEEQDKPLLALVHKHHNMRSSFNLRNLIDPKNYSSDVRIVNYFCLLDDTGAFSEKTIGLENKPLLVLEDEASFIEYISSKRSDAWITAAGFSGLESGVMSDELFEIFCKKIDVPIGLDGGYAEVDWLCIVKPLLTSKQKSILFGELKKVLETQLIDLNVEAKVRLVAGNKLDALGDNRQGVGLNEQGLPDIEWIEIPAGEFLYGDDRKKQTLERFKIAKYPITHQQFQAFIKAEDCDAEKYWLDLTKQNFLASEFQQGNRPKDTVDWFQAVAFTRWLSSQTGQKIQLPTEQQWEKAARGTNGRKYPWGDEFTIAYANCNESELGETNPVGLYEAVDSAYGVSEMSGNIWEWCENHFDADKRRRVLRGGSWNNSSNDLRSAFCVGNNSGDRYDFVGFRIVCSHPFTEN